MSVPQRFNDSEYKNWLKCVDASIVLKETLHPFVDTGVNELHEDIKQKVFSFLGGSNGTIQCSSCSSKKILHKRATGRNPAKWMINCPNNICDVWLDEILAVHNEPDNRSISWKNSDITKWGTDPYEIAKVFMPKGLDKKTNLPEELDFPAVLSLLKYCNYFSKSVPNTQLLTDLINVRNTLYHSGSFKVQDADRDKCIDMMSHLLIDLNLQGTVHTDLCMLKTEEISINFQEIETRALMNSVTLLKYDLEATESEIASLQETQIQLSMQTQKIKDDTGETNMKAETLEKDMKEVKRHLMELHQISDKILIFLEDNDIKDKDILAGAGCNENTIIDLRSRQFEIEKKILDIKSELSSVKEQMGRNKEETTRLRNEMRMTTEANKLEVKSCKREELAIWIVILVCLSSTACILPAIGALFILPICWTINPLIGDKTNWLTAYIIGSVMSGICCFALSAAYYYVKVRGIRWILTNATVFFSLLAVTAAVLFATTICSFQTRKWLDDEDLNFPTEKIKRTYDGVLTTKEPFSVAFDIMQIKFQCCGIQHYADLHCAINWNRTSIRTNDTMIIPISCCKSTDQGVLELRSATCIVDGSESKKDKPCWDDIRWADGIGRMIFHSISIFQVKQSTRG